MNGEPHPVDPSWFLQMYLQPDLSIEDLSYSVPIGLENVVHITKVATKSSGARVSGAV